MIAIVFSHCIHHRCWLGRLELNKGIGLETVHYLNDGLWHMKAIK